MMAYLRAVARLVKKQCSGLTVKKERCKRVGMTPYAEFRCYQHPKI